MFLIDCVQYSRYAQQVRDAQMKVDEESRAKASAADAKVVADRKAAATQNSLEESRTLLEQADRQRRTLEQELADTNESCKFMEFFFTKSCQRIRVPVYTCCNSGLKY